MTGNPWILDYFGPKGDLTRGRYNFKCNAHNLVTDQTCYLIYPTLYRRVSLNCQSSCDETRGSGARHRHHQLIARDPSSQQKLETIHTHKRYSALLYDFVLVSAANQNFFTCSLFYFLLTHGLVSPSVTSTIRRAAPEFSVPIPYLQHKRITIAYR